MPSANDGHETRRRLMHTRFVECDGFLRDDGLWEVEAWLRDTKPFTQRADRFRGELKPGDPDARFADDLVILIDAYKRHDWLVGAVDKRLREEFGKLQVEINDEKSRTVDLERGENFGFLGFDFRYLRGLSGAMRPHYTPKLKKRTALVRAQVAPAG